MGYFGILRAPDANAAPEIQGCHINFWVLFGLTGYRLIWDVGLFLTSSNNNVNSFQLALPFGTEPNPDRAFQDLSGLMSDADLVRLIFGRALETRHDANGAVIRFPETWQPGGDVRIMPTTAEYSPGLSGRNEAVWNLECRSPIGADPVYSRFRFHVQRPGRLWTWKKSLLRKNGARLDLRVADVREAWHHQRADELRDRLVTITQLRCFVIVPAWLQQINVHPVPYYIRLLEGRAWEGYLKRRTGLLRAPHLEITEFRPKGDLPVEPSSRFQAYLDFTSEFPHPTGGQYLALLLVVFLATGVAVRWDWMAATSTAATSAGMWVGRVVLIMLSALGIGIGALILALPKLRKRLASAIERIRKGEDWLRSKLAQH